MRCNISNYFEITIIKGIKKIFGEMAVFLIVHPINSPRYQIKKIAYFWQRINNHNNGRDKALDRYAASRR